MNKPTICQTVTMERSCSQDSKSKVPYEAKVILVFKNGTPFVPNYLSLLIETQVLRNLWGICEIAQLGSNPSLNKLSNELLYAQNGVVNKKMSTLSFEDQIKPSSLLAYWR
jgi:hypothetical protein